jgi:hypothetical protein
MQKCSIAAALAEFSSHGGLYGHEVTIQATRSNHCGAWPLDVETECNWRLRLPLAVPLPWSFLKELEYGWPNVVFRV